MILPEPISVTILVTKVFEELNIPYLIGGSVASTIYGIVRMTQDVDIIAEIKLDKVPTFIAALKTEFYMDDELIADSVLNNSSFNIIHRQTMFKVDVFIPRESPFQRSQYSRAQKQILYTQPNVSAYFASPEDTILAKLDWFRKGNEVSERQWRDVLGVLTVKQGELDIYYLREWASALNVSDLLEKALKETA